MAMARHVGAIDNEETLTVAFVPLTVENVRRVHRTRPTLQIVSVGRVPFFGPAAGSESATSNDTAQAIGQQRHADSACVMAPV